MNNLNITHKVTEIENFFPTYVEKEIAKIMLSPNIKWTYLSKITSMDSETYKLWNYKGNIVDSDAFSFQLDSNDPHYQQISEHIRIFINKHQNIKIEKILRILFVILPPNPLYKEDCHFLPHVDLYQTQCKNFLWYQNDNDAPTLFFDQLYEENKPIDYTKQEVVHKVYPKKNKGVLWNGNWFHSASVSKKSPRITLNVLFI